jgi:hypothetical protein
VNTPRPEGLPHKKDHHPLWEAALEAEQQTGQRESTAEAARAHLLIRAGRICGGAAILLTGIVLMVLPGPGLALIIAGLTILAIDVPFARRLRDIAVDRADRATSFIPKKLMIALVIGGTVAGLGLSVFLLVR